MDSRVESKTERAGLADKHLEGDLVAYEFEGDLDRGRLRGASCADSASCSASTDGAGMQSRSGRNGTGRVQAVRVSFVPIDLDLPLEEQHGGKFDASKFSTCVW